MLCAQALPPLGSPCCARPCAHLQRSCWPDRKRRRYQASVCSGRSFPASWTLRLRAARCGSASRLALQAWQPPPAWFRCLAIGLLLAACWRLRSRCIASANERELLRAPAPCRSERTGAEIEDREWTPLPEHREFPKARRNQASAASLLTARRSRPRSSRAGRSQRLRGRAEPHGKTYYVRLARTYYVRLAEDKESSGRLSIARRILTVVPLPSSDCTSRVPRCKSIARVASESPSPRPLGLVVK